MTMTMKIMLMIMTIRRRGRMHESPVDKFITKERERKEAEPEKRKPEI